MATIAAARASLATGVQTEKLNGVSPSPYQELGCRLIAVETFTAAAFTGRRQPTSPNNRRSVNEGDSCEPPYALCDRDGEPYYVGRTVQTPGTRLGEHRREATRRGRRSAVHCRTLELLEAGRGPAIWVLESGVAIRNVERRERHWIGYGEGAGWQLLNYSGWAGSVLVADEVQRERQAAIAAKQPRDRSWRFLPLCAEDQRVAAPSTDFDLIPF